MLRITRTAATVVAARASTVARTQQHAPIAAVVASRAFHAAPRAGLRFAEAAKRESEQQTRTEPTQATLTRSDEQEGSDRDRRASQPKQPKQSALAPANLRPDPMLDAAIARAEGRRDFSSSASSGGSSSTTVEVTQPITPVSDFDTVASAAAAPHIHIGDDYAAPSSSSATTSDSSEHSRYEFSHPQAAAAMSEAPRVEDVIHKDEGEAQAQASKGEEIKVEYPRSAGAGRSSSSASGRRPRKERSSFNPFSFLSSLPLPALPLPLPSAIAAQLPPPLRGLAQIANEVAANVAGGMRSTAAAASSGSSSSGSSSSSSSRGGAADALGKLFPSPSQLGDLASKAAPLVAKGLPGLVQSMPTPTAVLNAFAHVTSPAAATKPWGAATTSSASSTSSSSSSSTAHPSGRARGARRPGASKPLRSELLASMLRVDHAGEYGAQRIYDGQLFVLGAGKRPGRSGQSFEQATSVAGGGSASDVIEEMRAQEIEHLRTLEAMLPAYRVRPTALLPLWNIAGFALGAGSALMGPKAAMACTVAVEDVITSHYNDQLRLLNSPGLQASDQDRRLKEVIKRHRDDEQHHKAVGLEHRAEEAPAYKIMTQVIQAGCQAAIWISKKV